MNGGKRPGAGRPPGSANKKSQEIQRVLEALDCDPIKGMAYLAMNDTEALGLDEDVPVAIRAQMYKELAPYIAFKLKALEVSISDLPTHEELLAELQ